MRKIKFRAWDTKDKKYLYSNKQEFICTTHNNGLGVTIPYDSVNGKPYTDEECFDWADADLISGRYELEQFTELHDKSSNEIYEGDIVLLIRKNAKSIMYKVVWDSFYTGYYLLSLELDDVKFINRDEIRKRYKVIGNIHENKELLNGIKGTN